MAMVQHIPALDGPADPICSVCIANYNGERLLGECLNSVLAQTDSRSLQIIVHDDASTDGSVAFLREHYPQVDVLVSDENVGFCVGNNRMAALAKGRYLLLLNNDAALWPDATETLLRDAQREKRDCVLTLPQFDWDNGELIDRGCFLDPFYNPIPNLSPTRNDVAMGIGACLWMPATLWQQLGGFPEWMESIGEDLFLCCLARLTGHPVRVTASSGYRHRNGASFGGGGVKQARLDTTLRRRRLSERNKTFALFIFTPGFVRPLLLGTHALLLLIEGLILSVARRDMRLYVDVYIGALRSLLAEHRQLSKVRTEIQSSRSINWRLYYKAFRWWPRKLSMLRQFGFPVVRS
jgi:GT2 family glycosyltransferase